VLFDDDSAAQLAEDGKKSLVWNQDKTKGHLQKAWGKIMCLDHWQKIFSHWSFSASMQHL